MNKKLAFLLITFAYFAISGCVSPKIALEYRTETTLELEGKVFVGDFQYFPKSGISPAQIPNTAIGGGIVLTEPVGEFFTNAVRREFRQAGISLKQGGCQLTGEIKNILLDDLGFSVDYDLEVRYTLRDSDDAVLLDKSYAIALERMTKLVVVEVVLSNLNRMFSSNIKQLMEDKLFARSLESSCNE